jgi:hypothetical protein
VSIKDCFGWALLPQALIMHWRIWDLCGPANLIASTVIELDDTLPRFTNIQWDSDEDIIGLCGVWFDPEAHIPPVEYG